MREYAFETLLVCMYVAVFTFLHYCCMYVYMLHLRLYNDTCPSLLSHGSSL